MYVCMPLLNKIFFIWLPVEIPILFLSGGTRAGQGSVYPTGGHQDLRRHGVQPSRSSCQQGNY